MFVAQLSLILTSPKKERRLDVVNTLDSLLRRIQKIFPSSLEHLGKSDQNYYKTVGFVVAEKFRSIHDWKLVDDKLRWPKNVMQDEGKTFPWCFWRAYHASFCFSEISEEMSDSCMYELANSRNELGHCSPSSNCVNVMLELGHTEYSLLHQLLYLNLARQVCFKLFFYLFFFVTCQKLVNLLSVSV